MPMTLNPPESAMNPCSAFWPRCCLLFFFWLHAAGCIYGEKSLEVNSPADMALPPALEEMGVAGDMDLAPDGMAMPPRPADPSCGESRPCQQAGQRCVEGWCVCAPKENYSDAAVYTTTVEPFPQEGFEVVPYYTSERVEQKESYGTDKPHFMLVSSRNATKGMGGQLLDGRGRPVDPSQNRLRGRFTLTRAQLVSDIGTQLQPPGRPQGLEYDILSFSTLSTGAGLELFLMIALKTDQGRSPATLMLLNYSITANPSLEFSVTLRHSWLGDATLGLDQTVHWGVTAFEAGDGVGARAVYMVERDDQGSKVTYIHQEGDKAPTTAFRGRVVEHEFKPLKVEQQVPASLPRAVRGRLELKQRLIEVTPEFALVFSFLAEGSAPGTFQPAFHAAYPMGKTFDMFTGDDPVVALASGIDLVASGLGRIPDAPSFGVTLRDTTDATSFLAQGVLAFPSITRDQVSLNFFEAFALLSGEPLTSSFSANANLRKFALSTPHDTDTVFDLTSQADSPPAFFAISGQAVGILAPHLVQILPLSSPSEQDKLITLRTSVVPYDEIAYRWATRTQVLFLKTGFGIEAVPLTAQGAPYCDNAPAPPPRP